MSRNLDLESIKPSQGPDRDALSKVPERLEVLRNALGISGIKEFWRRAVREGDFGGSYASVATYHRAGGPVSLEYLSAVDRAFGARFSWLAFGEGPMTQEEYERERELEAAGGTLAERALGTDARYEELLRSPVRELLEATVARLWDSEPERGTTADYSREDLCRGLAGVLLLPSKLWGFAGLGFKLRTQRYLVGMLGALETLVHDAREGHAASDYAQSVVHRVRTLVDEEN